MQAETSAGCWAAYPPMQRKTVQKTFALVTAMLLALSAVVVLLGTGGYVELGIEKMEALLDDSAALVLGITFSANFLFNMGPV